MQSHPFGWRQTPPLPPPCRDTTRLLRLAGEGLRPLGGLQPEAGVPVLVRTLTPVFIKVVCERIHKGLDIS